MSVKFERDYLVGDDKVFLSIGIGDKQIGTSVVSLSGELLRMGEIEDLLLGKGADLDGKQLNIKTVVTDVNDKSNKTSVTFTHKGGKEDETFTLQSEVKEEGDSLIYRTTINLIQA